LSTQIASGNAPDLVGPVGVGGLAAFQGQWLDLAPQIEKWSYDLSQFDPAAVDFYKVAEGQIGIPFAVYPSMLWYKADMFEEAGLELPPHQYGAKYKMPDGSEVDWNYDTVLNLAKLLTVDKSGKDATEAGFDPKSIVQYGFEPQRDDLRGLGAYWGAGSLAASDGKTVQVPDAWKVAWKFWYDGMWTNHTIMTGSVAESEEFSGGGYTFFSGRVAMSENFLWTTYGVADAGTDWDLAAIPAYNGKTTSPLNADTFGILKGTKNPDTAFAGLTYVLGDASDKLLNLYGGMPARPDKQDAFFETLGKTEGFPEKVDWQVAKDSLQYADSPNFEAPMPKYNETLTILEKYESKFATTPGLDMDKEIEALRAEIQAAWDS
jgi:multiple sugar transport system substrate-binding protein